jgi:hypothetical protein
MLSLSCLCTVLSGDRVIGDSCAVTGAIRRGGDRGLFEYATALINVNESAGKRGSGLGFSR